MEEGNYRRSLKTPKNKHKKSDVGASLAFVGGKFGWRNLPVLILNKSKPRLSRTIGQPPNFQPSDFLYLESKVTGLFRAKIGMRETVGGGYKPITAGQIINVCVLARSGLSTTAYGAYLYCHELVATRCKARGKIRYTIGELAKRMKVGEQKAKEVVEELEEWGLLSWSSSEIRFSTTFVAETYEIAEELKTSPKRPIPIPRPMIRACARNSKTTEVIAALAHFIRCLFKDGKVINSKGCIKASEISRIFGISKRSVLAARKWLLGKKFLLKIPVHQLVLNKWGQWFYVNIWLKSKRKKPKFAPLKQLPSITTNQYKSDGTCINNKSIKNGKAGYLRRSKRRPDIKNILPDDLKRVGTMLILYRQALKAGWFPNHSRAYLENFIAAGTRGFIVGGESPRSVRIFIGIIKKGLFGYITGAQRERAYRAMKRYEARHPGAFDMTSKLSSRPMPGAGIVVKELLHNTKPVPRAHISEFGEPLDWPILLPNTRHT